MPQSTLADYALTFVLVAVVLTPQIVSTVIERAARTKRLDVRQRTDIATMVAGICTATAPDDVVRAWHFAAEVLHADPALLRPDDELDWLMALPGWLDRVIGLGTDVRYLRRCCTKATESRGGAAGDPPRTYGEAVLAIASTAKEKPGTSPHRETRDVTP